MSTVGAPCTVFDGIYYRYETSTSPLPLRVVREAQRNAGPRGVVHVRRVRTHATGTIEPGRGGAEWKGRDCSAEQRVAGEEDPVSKFNPPGGGYAAQRWHYGGSADILSLEAVIAAAYHAGWRGNALLTAVAIQMAENGAHDATLWVSDPPTAGCPNGSWDRGLWQINSCYHPEVSNAQAASPSGNAAAAYAISNGGKDFSPWATYNSGAYKAYIGSGPGGLQAAINDWIASPSSSDVATVTPSLPSLPSVGQDVTAAAGAAQTWWTSSALPAMEKAAWPLAVGLGVWLILTGGQPSKGVRLS